MTYLFNPVEAVLGVPDQWPASVHKTIVSAHCAHAVVTDSLGGNDRSLVADTAESSTFDDRAPRVMRLDDLNSILFVHLLEAVLQEAARAKSTDEENPLEPATAALGGSFCNLGTNKLQDVPNDGVENVLQNIAECPRLASVQCRLVFWT